MAQDVRQNPESMRRRSISTWWASSQARSSGASPTRQFIRQSSTATSTSSSDSSMSFQMRSFALLFFGYVVGDAIEGYNTTHDVCRLMINCAVEAANRSNYHQIANYEYPVVNRPDCCPRDLHDRAIWLS